jgi:NADH:ubiquinone oxidoreductase subunit E
MFKLVPKGKYCIQVCEGLSCYLVGGSDPIIEHISKRLKIKPGETTADGKFSLEIVQCLAACSSAPAIRINDELYENVTLSRIDDLIDSLANG